MDDLGGMIEACSFPNSSRTTCLLFKKSLSNLQEKDALYADLLSLKVRAICSDVKKDQPPSSGDPLLRYILGFSDRPTNETLLNYYRKHASDQSDQLDLVHMCIFLDEKDCAKKLLGNADIDFRVLSMTDDPDFERKLDNDCANNWLDLLKPRTAASMLKAKENAERNGFLLRFRIQGKVSTLCEMAARGYYWDAFILMSLIYPHSELIGSLRSYVWKMLDIGWVDELNRLSVQEVNFAKLIQMGCTSWECYNVLKASFELHKDSLYARSSIYKGIRACLLSAVCEVHADVSPHEMLKNFTSLDSVFLQECLPALQRYYLEPAFAVIQDFIHVILHLSNILKNDDVARYENDSLGIIINLANSWIARGDLPSDGSAAEAQRGIRDVIYTFIDDVANVSKIWIKDLDYKVYVILALRVAEVAFASTVCRSSSTIISDLLDQCVDGEQLLKHLMKNVDLLEKGSAISNIVNSVRNCFLSVQKILTKQRQLRAQAGQTTPTALPHQSSDYTINCTKDGLLNTNEDVTSLSKPEDVIAAIISLDECTDVAVWAATENMSSVSCLQTALADHTVTCTTDDVCTSLENFSTVVPTTTGPAEFVKGAVLTAKEGTSSSVSCLQTAVADLAVTCTTDDVCTSLENFPTVVPTIACPAEFANDAVLAAKEGTSSTDRNIEHTDSNNTANDILCSPQYDQTKPEPIVSQENLIDGTTEIVTKWEKATTSTTQAKSDGWDKSVENEGPCQESDCYPLDRMLRCGVSNSSPSSSPSEKEELQSCSHLSQNSDVIAAEVDSPVTKIIGRLDNMEMIDPSPFASLTTPLSCDSKSTPMEPKVDSMVSKKPPQPVSMFSTAFVQPKRNDWPSANHDNKNNFNQHRRDHASRRRGNAHSGDGTRRQSSGYASTPPVGSWRNGSDVGKRGGESRGYGGNRRGGYGDHKENHEDKYENSRGRGARNVRGNLC